jgi:hypothetical protein
VNVFISYRRSDTQDFAARLAEQLRRELGATAVFMDIDDIAAGEAFPRRLEQALASAAVCLVIIGQGWTGPREGARPRVHDEGDFVRAEVRQALTTGKRTIPVLAHGAAMPAPADLPEDLGALPSLNAVSVRHTDFERDVAHLVTLVRGQTKTKALGARAVAARVGLGLLVGAIGLLTLGVVHGAVFARPLSETVGSAGAVVLVIALGLVSGVVAALRWRR